MVYLGWDPGSRRVALIKWVREIQYKDVLSRWPPHGKLGANSTRIYWGIYCDLLCGLWCDQTWFMCTFWRYSECQFVFHILLVIVISIVSNCHYRIIWSDLFFAVKLNWKYWTLVPEWICSGWWERGGDG